MGGLARSYESSGRIADAEKTFQEACGSSARMTGSALTRFGAFYDRQGKYPQSIAA